MVRACDKSSLWFEILLCHFRGKRSGKVAIFLVSDPVKIECPNHACCGTEDDKELCPPHGKFPTAEMKAYHVGGTSFELCPLPEVCIGRNKCAEGYTGMLCHNCESAFARRESMNVAPAMDGVRCTQFWPSLSSSPSASTSSIQLFRIVKRLWRLRWRRLQ